MLIAGRHTYGKTDRVAALDIYVATTFFHFCFIPIIPYESYIVVRHDGSSFHGIPIGLQLKSVLIAWWSVLSFLLAMATWPSVAICYDLAPSLVAPFVALGTVLLVVLYLLDKTPGIGPATLERAVELSHIAGISTQGRWALEQSYGSGKFVSGELQSQLKMTGMELVDLELKHF